MKNNEANKMDYETMQLVRENHKLLLAIAQEMGLFEEVRNEVIEEVKENIHNTNTINKNKKRTV